ncbi:RNA polymerase sigma factor [Dokdonella sp.]|uniref:RNA polymerase sigma factor n=1 Tax=Dokdonella sp. TaxID=2291710 RepID=UPI003C540B2D
MEQNREGLARIFRAESGHILAALMMHTRDIDQAEDALADGLLQATRRWADEGMPANPAGWLFMVARRRLIDSFRKESLRNSEVFHQAIQDVMFNQDPFDIPGADEAIPDERLRLIFTCCHPALAEDARVPLTLKTLCGLSVREIARAFLVSEAAMNQRLTRAKRKILKAGIAYAVPEGEALSERLPSVLSVIYLIYNESFNAFEGQTLSRQDLAEESIRLARLLDELLPRPEVEGLLALLLLNHSRSAARSSAEKSFIPLELQDRARWDRSLIREGTQRVLNALAKGEPDPYQIQAAISALHAMAPDWGSTDWVQIQGLYASLQKLNPSPVVALNRAMAFAYGGDADTAARQLQPLAKALADYQPFHVACAELAARTGRRQAALDHYATAMTLTKNSAERDFLIGKRDLLMRGG